LQIVVLTSIVTETNAQDQSPSEGKIPVCTLKQ